MTAWRCRRWRPDLVDLALRTLAASDVRRVEAHLAGCPDCRADLAALRDTTHALANQPSERPADAFWLAQRQAIMRRVRTAPAPTRVQWPRWQTVGGLAAAMLAVVLGRSVLPPAAPMARMSIDRLDDDALVHLHDLLPAIAPASAIDDADGDMLSIHDLGDAELDVLGGFMDDRS